ncbi:BrnA antitoxin family protein [Candidiatus Paracoxiella cheracis]|uniref:BrnA antitoxin family protein n=1 Tax=Candidiatus Paracoxiella cheracis TaxID=3405120 RepID=UPI003BF4EC5E
MKSHYNFKNGKRGAVVSTANKQRITIRLDPDIIRWFKQRVHDAGGGSYQNLMNNALREYIDSQGESLEKILRRVLREELQVKRRKKST